jgi:trimethylamine--corrinoid protein Co-methyltransferase
MELSKARVLDREELLLIDRSTKQVLQEVGVEIPSRRVLGLLADRGCTVDFTCRVVRFDPEIVDWAVRSTPPEFSVYRRNGSGSFPIGIGQKTRIASGHCAVFLFDPNTGRRTPMVLEEIGLFAKLANYLDQIDLVAPQALPMDRLGKSAILHAVDAVLNNTEKPVLFTCEDDTEVSGILELVKNALQSEDLSHHPCVVAQFSPSSPLYWNQGTVEGFVRVVEEGVPCTILPGVIAGATGPFTLAGALVQKNAEVLAGVVLAQVVKEGAPLLAVNGTAKFDMRSANAVFSAAENTLLEIAGNQLSDLYGIPSHGCVPTSDSHVLDQQIGIENMRSILMNIASGASLIVNAGMFASGRTASFEQLVIDNEVAKIARRLHEGIKVDRETLAVEAIRRVGPKGNYLLDSSTVSHLRSGEWLESELFVRETYDRWEQEGRKGLVGRAAEVVDILGAKEDVPLPQEVREAMRAVIAAFESRQG